MNFGSCTSVGDTRTQQHEPQHLYVQQCGWILVAVFLSFHVSWYTLLVCILCFTSGYVAGAVPPTCPGDTLVPSCTVTGDLSGITIWRANGSSSLCVLAHVSTSPANCGPSKYFRATPGTGFGTNGPSYTSTLSATATPTLNGTLVECFGPANNVDPGNRVGSSTLHIVG